jgi:hypothetical protein
MVYAAIIVNICCIILLHLMAEDLVKAVENWLVWKLGCDLHTCKLTSCGRWISLLMTSDKRPVLTGIEIFIFGVLSVLC